MGAMLHAMASSVGSASLGNNRRWDWLPALRWLCYPCMDRIYGTLVQRPGRCELCGGFFINVTAHKRKAHGCGCGPYDP